MSKMQLLGVGAGVLFASFVIAGIGVLTKPKPAEASWGGLKYCFQQCGNNSACLQRCMGKTQNACQEGGGEEW